jgi:hypothetical protein
MLSEDKSVADAVRRGIKFSLFAFVGADRLELAARGMRVMITDKLVSSWRGGARGDTCG